jgi:hypothetical protein
MDLIIVIFIVKDGKFSYSPFHVDMKIEQYNPKEWERQFHYISYRELDLSQEYFFIGTITLKREISYLFFQLWRNTVGRR